MIQVPFTDAPSKTKAKQIADRLVLDIGTNASRFDAAVLRGQTPNADYQAGDAGYLPRDIEAQQLVGTEFMNTAFSLRQGEVSRLLENTRGYQIIKVTETYELKNLELDDIYQLGEPMTVRDFIGNSILNERQQAVLAQAQQELITELRSGNPFQINESLLNW
jgi:parvulin-like peptidyl-prolyl isomerase